MAVWNINTVLFHTLKVCENGCYQAPKTHKNNIMKHQFSIKIMIIKTIINNYGLFIEIIKLLLLLMMMMMRIIVINFNINACVII